MAYDARIILAQQPLNALAAIQGGTEAAAGQNAFMRQAELQKMLKANGPGIMAGDKNALNAFAMFDPAAAMGIQAQRQSMAALDAGQRRAAEEYARGLSAEQRAAESAKIEQGLSGAAFFYSKGDQAGYAAFLQQQGIDPAMFPFEAFPAHAAKYGEVLDVLKGFTPEPIKPADEYGRYVQEEMAAGRKPLDRIGYEQAKKGKGFSMTTNPDGSTTISMGGPQGREPTVGDVYTPGTPLQAVELIDSILANPALGRITGPLEGGGGNNIDEIGPLARMWYGEKGIDAIDKTNQLQSQAWMAARAMLKGGGQITDYESRKAEAAVARLSRAKGETEFRAALKELRDAITEGQAKLEAAQSGGKSQPGGIPEGIDPADWEYMTPEERALFQ